MKFVEELDRNYLEYKPMKRQFADASQVKYVSHVFEYDLSAQGWFQVSIFMCLMQDEYVSQAKHVP